MTEAIMAPRPLHVFLSAEEEIRLSSFAPDLIKVLRPDAPIRPDGCNLRFGTKGSLLIRSTGTWSDFEAGKSGHGALALIAHLKACPLAEAIAWARDWLAQHPGRGSFSVTPNDDDIDAGEQDTISRSTFIATFVENSRPISGTPGERYLQGRGIEPLNLPPEVVEVEGLRWLDIGRGDEGALLVKITDEQGEPVGILLTFVTPDGCKSSTQPSRQIFRGPPDWRRRGLVRLDIHSEPCATLYLTEGVEDALSLGVAGYSGVVATLGVGAIGRVHIPHGICVVRDGDRPGSEADHALYRGWVRLCGQGVSVRVTDTPIGEDANSILTGSGVDALKRLVEAASDQLGRVDPEPFLDEAARLDLAGYERARDPIAKLLGWRVSSLDEDRKVRRMQWASSAATDPDIEPVPEEHQPWTEPVPNIGPVLDAALAELGRYIVAD